MSRANAILTPKGRLRLARCVVEDGWPLRRAAERFRIQCKDVAVGAVDLLADMTRADEQHRILVDPTRPAGLATASMYR